MNSDFHAVVHRPELVADLIRVLTRCGSRVESLPFTEFAAVGGRISDRSPRFWLIDCGELIIELEDFEKFDGLVATAFGGEDVVLFQAIQPMLRAAPVGRPPWPRFLIPKEEPGECDIRTVLGSATPIPYMRWNLDELPGVGSLAGYSLYEPDATLIRRLIRGADLLRLDRALDQPNIGIDCDRLAELAEAAVMAARHAPGPPVPACSDAIARMCELRDDSLERAVLLAVGHALVVAYEPRWWSTVERIGLDRLCAEVGLKRDRCGEREAALWSRLSGGLTRIDRWYDLPRSQADAEEAWGEADQPLPTTGLILQRTTAAARGWFPGPFAELRFRHAVPELLSDDRPVLVARKVAGGWDVRYLEREQPPRQARVREEAGRMSRILLPLLRKMADDIAADVPVGECGWVPFDSLDPGCGGKAGTKFRKDKSDLNLALAPAGLGIEPVKRVRMRLAGRLAEARARIEIFEG